MSDPRKFPDNTDHVKGQGILFVRSRVAEPAKSKLASDTYTGWYDDEHIRDVLQTSGFTAAFRCSDTRSPSAYASSSNPKPVLAYYPFEDVAFTLSDEFKTIPISSPTLPGPSCFDVADFDICCLALDSKTERKSGVAGPPKFVLSYGIHPAKSLDDAAAAKLFENQTAVLEKESGYMRTLTFHHLYARGSAEQKKSFEESGGSSSEALGPEVPYWLAMYEFSEKPSDAVVEKVKNESKLADATSELFVWQVEKPHGNHKFFGH